MKFPLVHGVKGGERDIVPHNRAVEGWNTRSGRSDPCPDQA